MSREKTKDEIKDEFLNYVAFTVKYWDNLDIGKRESMEGVVHSVLCAIDGYSAGTPGFLLAPIVHEDDKQDCIENDDDYYPQNKESDVKGDIAGSLHEEIGRYYNK